MTQVHSGVPSGTIDPVHATGGQADGPAEPFAGWLALADPDGPIDLQRLFPELEVWVEPNSVAFSHALTFAQPIMVVLIAPPAGPGDLERVAMWLGTHRDTSVVLLSPHQAGSTMPWISLAMHPGRAFSREELIRHVWHSVGANERVVDVYVYWLRAKIEIDPANPIHLMTVRGSGYLFDPPENAPSSPAGAALLNVNEPPTSR